MKRLKIQNNVEEDFCKENHFPLTPNYFFPLDMHKCFCYKFHKNYIDIALTNFEISDLKKINGSFSVFLQ